MPRAPVVSPAEGHLNSNEAGEKRRGGRAKGVPNKFTTLCVEAMSGALDTYEHEVYGSGPLGWFKRLMNEEPKTFAALIAKRLPTDVNLKADMNSLTEVRAVIVQADQR